MTKITGSGSRILLQDPDPNPDPLVRGMDPRIQIRIRIHTKMSWIRNTGLLYLDSENSKDVEGEGVGIDTEIDTFRVPADREC